MGQPHTPKYHKSKEVAVKDRKIDIKYAIVAMNDCGVNDFGEDTRVEEQKFRQVSRMSRQVMSFEKSRANARVTQLLLQ